MSESTKVEENTKRKKERLWTPMFIIIVVGVLCCFLVGHATSAGYSVFVDRIGGTATIVGVSATAYFLAAGVARVFSGPTIDARGRQFTMILGDAFLLIGTLGPVISYDDMSFIFWRILQGVGFALFSTAAATAAADVLPESRLGEGISYYGLGQAISMGIAPIIAIALASSDPPSNLFIGCLLFAITATIFSMFCTYEKNPTKLPKTSVYRTRWEEGEVGRFEGGANEPNGPADTPNSNISTTSKNKGANDNKSFIARLADRIFEKHALPAAVTIAFMSTSFGFSMNFMGLYGTTLQVGSPGIYFTVVSIAMVGIRFISGRFMDTTPPLVLMGIAAGTGILTYSIMLVCFFLQGSMSIDWLFYFAGLPFGITMGLGMPVNQSLAVKMSPPDRWGAANGLYQLGLDVAIGASCFIWGLLAEYFTFAASLSGVIICLALSFIIACIVYPKDAR